MFYNVFSVSVMLSIMFSADERKSYQKAGRVSERMYEVAHFRWVMWNHNSIVGACQLHSWLSLPFLLSRHFP